MSEANQEPGADMDGIRAVIRKVVVVVVVVSIVAVFGFWLGWVRAPAPDEVCKHKIELVFETAGQNQDEGAGALVGQLEAKCITALRRKIQLRGKVVYAEYAKCVTSATTLSDAERC